MPRSAEPVPHVLHVFSTFGMGGPQVRFVSLANALKGRYRHTVLAMDGNLAASDGLDRGVDCGFAEMRVARNHGISFANVWHARRLLQRLRPSLLMTYNWGTIEWSLADWPALCRHVHVEDGFGPDESPERQNPRRALVRRLLLSRALVIVPSRTLHRVATERWRLRRVLYLPNGIDCARFARPPDESLAASLGLGGGGPVIGAVAGLRPEKNLGRLLRIFARLPRASGTRLAIIGDGPERGDLAALAAGLGIADRVVMPGAIAHPERLLRRFDIFALSSDTEQMPNAILEAMAAALPIVATDVGDLKAMVAPENAAFVLPREDEAAFAAALAALLEDAPSRRRIGRCNEERVRAQYALEQMVARYDRLFSGGDPGAAC